MLRNKRRYSLPLILLSGKPGSDYAGFNHDELRRYLRQHLQEAGVAKAVAGEVADNLVESSLQGHDSHGVTLIPRYIEAIRAGELDPQATPQLLRDAGPVISFHGGTVLAS